LAPSLTFTCPTAPAACNVRRDPARLVAGEQLGRRASPRLVLEVDVGKLLAVVVAHHKAGGLFFDGPRRREAALRPPCWHSPRRGGRVVVGDGNVLTATGASESLP